MSSPVDIIEEYLVSLGFKVNNTQLNSLLKGLDEAKSQTASFAVKMSSNLATSGVAIISFIATATAATGKFLESMADADMETEKLSRHLWITEESTRSLMGALSAMGEDLGSLNDIAMNPELRGQFAELYQLSQKLRGPQELQDQLKFIRSITFELKKMRLIANYTMQNVAFYLTKYLGKNLVDIKAKLQKFNEFLIKNMPKISATIAKGLYAIVRLAETLVVFLGKIITMVMDFFHKLPPTAKASLLALAALGFAALNPFTLFVTALMFILLLLEDYYSYTQGKKSLLGGMWSNIDNIAGKIGGIGKEFDDMVQKMTGMTTLENIFAGWDKAVTSIYEGLKGINDETKILLDLFDKKTTGKEAFKNSLNPMSKISNMLLMWNPALPMYKLLNHSGTFLDGLFDPFLNSISSGGSSKTNNVDVKVSQNITSNDPVAAGKESGKYIEQVITRSLAGGNSW